MSDPIMDTALRTSDLDGLAFDARGLVTVVAQEARTGEVLMVAWANRDALEASLVTGWMHYWSRSRGRLWKKGETSGNVQRVRSLHADCDRDTVLATVAMEGPACHTGERTCFASGGAGDAPAPGPGRAAIRGAQGADASGSDPAAGSGTDPDQVLGRLWTILAARDRDRPPDSYTTRLLEDENLRLKKLGEETAELILSLARREPGAPEEAADLVYHLLTALLGAGHSLRDVTRVLEGRFGPPEGSDAPGGDTGGVRPEAHDAADPSAGDPGEGPAPRS